MKYRCAVAATGVAAGSDMEGASVFPFILRGVRLLGVDSTLPVNCEGYDLSTNCKHAQERQEIWGRLSKDLPIDTLHKIWKRDSPNGNLIPLDDVGFWAERVLHGKVRGRLVVDVGGSSK